MQVSEIKQSVLLCRDASLVGDYDAQAVTPFIWGHKGLGKSSLVKQVCREHRWGFVDFRASQIEGSDIRGYPFPEKDEKGRGVRTRFLPPADLPQGHGPDEKCPACDSRFDDAKLMENPEAYVKAIIDWEEAHGGRKLAQSFYCKGELFLDELPRAEDDVIQAAFQLVLDKAVGQYRLPPGWHVVAAGNYLEGGYTQNGFQDEAWINRFCHLTLATSEEYSKEWADYMVRSAASGGGSGEDAAKIISFIAVNPAHLTGGSKGDLGFTIKPSPRSWSMVLQVMANAKKYPAKIVKGVISGLVGMEIASFFERFDIDVTPRDIIDLGMDKLRSKLDSFNRNQLCGLVWGLSATAKQMEKSAERMDNVMAFMVWLAANKKTSDARDLAVVLGRELMASEVQHLGGALLSNPGLAKLASKINKKAHLSWVERLTSSKELTDVMAKVSFGKD